MSELEPTGFRVHQEEDVIGSRHLIRVGVGSLLVGSVGVFFAGVILTASTGSLRPSAAGPRGTLPAPRAISGVEQTPIRDVRDGLALRDSQRHDLGTWGWADRDAGLATIPVERAIDVVLRRETP